MKTIFKFGIGFSLLAVILMVTIVFILPKVIKGYDFINDKTCAPPCLGNIIPGVTTDRDAFEIASANKHFGSCNLIDQTKQGGTKYILCQSYKSYITISLNNNLVDGFGIRPYPKISINSIIDKFGYPDGVSCGFVNLPDYPRRVRLILWFDAYNSRVVLPDFSGNTCTISKDSIIEIVEYGTKGSYQESRGAAERLGDFQLWNGFTSYTGKDLP